MEKNLRRKTIRLKNYNYAQSGYYFVTICTHQRIPWFGKIQNMEMLLNCYGDIAMDEWNKTICLRQIVSDAFVIMPNHVHGIIFLADNQSKKSSIPNIVGAYKSAVARRIKVISNNQIAQPIWQRSYYEHIIRTEQSLTQIRDYVIYNPHNWEKDELFIKT